ncbi:aldehyde dehydrogenase (NADP(+)) [Nocardioides hwasunensis]|uniref:Aldehyde dehydrogenase (NADP(+)) n=1 Tax=Nocardioides hwasunensis TaxID=397258 RepID=A0ABR8MKI3_9ACTN|nr:aldehyde dehydrogenase (NADP(+)) [Nocardioides hwasunensis]MBD3915576.1 aldehyde dehydrogenase (NADP(+)) [Nocardioides hwasunensis]
MSEIDHGTETALAAAHRAPLDARPEERARWLRAIADGLDAEADRLVALAGSETHLPEARLRGEITRTSFQSRLFADRLETGALGGVVVDHADPEWGMGPRPDIRRTSVPIGPVLVFAASNFPFAFSVAGGDTISALAAGCPVVVKTHPGHPELSRATAEVVRVALADAGAPDGVFATIEGVEEGARAVQDPRVKAVAFTGSQHGGRALFDLAVSRTDPVPFYGELGSTNPVVVTPSGWVERPQEIVEGFAGSFTMGAGQFCTQPGVVLVPDVSAFVALLDVPAVHPMLDQRIDEAYRDALTRLSDRDGIDVLAVGPGSMGSPAATVLGTTASAVLADPDLVTTEVFGPATVLVGYTDVSDALAVLDLVGGALTATIQGTAALDADAPALLTAMARVAGRVVYNQWPTGVTVSDAQQHGGPWPATTAPTTTSVGTAAIHRFLRPVAFQNVPGAGLPPELRG